MAADKKRLAELGMVPPLATELARQIDGGAKSAVKLAELSASVPLARELVRQMNASAGNSRKLAEVGMVPALAKEAALQISGGTPTPAPSWTVQPSISGTPTEGQTLTGSDGTIINGTVSSRAWLRNGSAISGANGGTYLLVADDVGTNISYRPTATGAGGSTNATSSSVGPIASASYPWVNPEAQAIATAATQYPMDNVYKGALDTFVGSLKTAGVWAKLTYLSNPGLQTSGNVPFNWKNPAQLAVAVGTPISDDRGATPTDGNYFSTNVSWASLVTQNSALIGVWTPQEGQGTGILLNTAVTGNVRLSVRNASDQVGGRVNSAASVLASVTINTAAGLTIIQRADASNLQYWVNGTQRGGNVASASSTPETSNLLFGFGPGSTDPRYIAMLLAGPSLNGTEHTALYNALSAFVTAIGGLASYTPIDNAVSTTLAVQEQVSVPDIPGYTTGAANGFTNTGLTYDGTNFLISDDGRYGTQSGSYDGTNWRPKLHKVSTAGALLSSIDVYALGGGVGGAGTVQGNCIDGDGNYWIARAQQGGGIGVNKVIKLSPAGAVLASFDFAFDQGANALGYDPVRNWLWVAGFTSQKTLYAFDLAGMPVGKMILHTPAGGPPSATEAIDQITITGGEIFITTAPNGTTAMVKRFNLATRAPVINYSLTGALCIEGIAIVGTAMWVGNDSGFHVQVPNLNQLRRYTLP